jgi:hypothetical protein
MTKFFLSLFLIFTLTIASGAQQNTSPANSQDTIRITYDSEKITVSNKAIGFTTALISPTCVDCPTNPLRASLATCTVETDSVRILSSGDTPDATTGLLVTSGQSFSVFYYPNIAAFRAIRVTNDATLNCQYARLP